MWFAVWSLLVVGTLVGAFFLGRRLWRSVVELGRELARAGEAAGALAARAEELAEIAARERSDTSATLLADRDELREVVLRLRAARRARRDLRAERHADVARGWRAYWT
ncbi:hypothetical protein [Cellulomonas gelida]|uniref:Uncharacterized protein n=1 Tax=Cellulomonas gelida TaxID=1712 RepID=A0A4Y3KIP4_9CELL|nr:hypothetical protein [Cellulomonas gelida]GEA82848.1 hypothetical protein CGE01nite_00990 [Cellulomonas gelida]GGL34456.1 hypothetical protein GCM10009774_26360 [Cellulomonas gelida]